MTNLNSNNNSESSDLILANFTNGSTAPKKKAKTALASLEEMLWDAANKLRNKMESSEYKHVVLGLLFLKYVSDTFSSHYNKLNDEMSNPDSEAYIEDEEARQMLLEDRDSYTADGVFWVPDGHRWEDLQAQAKDVNIGQIIDNAMEAIEKENPTLKGVLPKEYGRKELSPETLGGIVDLFSREDLASAEHADEDVLGKIYQYFLGKFQSQEGKLGGEFFTPSGIVQLMVDMIEPYNGRVYDPAMGSGGMFVQAAKFIQSHGGSKNDISVFGQEYNSTTWRLAKMNLALRGIEANVGAKWGDTFSENQHPDLKADFILANPPFNDKDWERDKVLDDPRWVYGIPPQGNANYGWIQHMLYHLAPTGTMAMILANGALTAGGEELAIRKKLIDEDKVECIVSLPDRLFYTTGIPVSLWILTHDKSDSEVKSEKPQRARQGEVLFIDARNLGTMVSKKLRELKPNDIDKIASTYNNWRSADDDKSHEDTAGFAISVSLEDVKNKNYVLTAGSYVGAEAVEEFSPEELASLVFIAKTELNSLISNRKKLSEKATIALNSLEVKTNEY
jgi:type I restriction enzyme M protein